jgi:hypothetical protein
MWRLLCQGIYFCFNRMFTARTRPWHIGNHSYAPLSIPINIGVTPQWNLVTVFHCKSNWKLYDDASGLKEKKITLNNKLKLVHSDVECY